MLFALCLIQPLNGNVAAELRTVESLHTTGLEPCRKQRHGEVVTKSIAGKHGCCLRICSRGLVLTWISLVMQTSSQIE